MVSTNTYTDCGFHVNDRGLTGSFAGDNNVSNGRVANGYADGDCK